MLGTHRFVQAGVAGKDCGRGAPTAESGHYLSAHSSAAPLGPVRYLRRYLKEPRTSIGGRRSALPEPPGAGFDQPSLRRNELQQDNRIFIQILRLIWSAVPVGRFPLPFASRKPPLRSCLAALFFFHQSKAKLLRVGEDNIVMAWKWFWLRVPYRVHSTLN